MIVMVGGVQSNFYVKPNSVEVVLRLSWGCDNTCERTPGSKEVIERKRKS